MYFFVALAVICIFVVIIIFSFPQFSPIPYFPSNGKDMPLILEALSIRDNQVIVDLGAGDGIVIFQAAEKAHQNKLNTKFIAIEINPILLFILSVRRMMHPNKNNIRILKRDMFSTCYSDFIDFKTFDFATFYIYISPWFIDKTVANITRQIPRFDLVSYFYQVKCLPDFEEKMKEGIHKVYRYRKSI